MCHGLPARLAKCLQKGGVGSDFPQISHRTEFSEWITNRTLAGHNKTALKGGYYIMLILLFNYWLREGELDFGELFSMLVAEAYSENNSLASSSAFCGIEASRFASSFCSRKSSSTRSKTPSGIGLCFAIRRRLPSVASMQTS